MQYIIALLVWCLRCHDRRRRLKLYYAEAKAGFVPDSDIDSAGDRCADTDDVSAEGADTPTLRIKLSRVESVAMLVLDPSGYAGECTVTTTVASAQNSC